MQNFVISGLIRSGTNWLGVNLHQALSGWHVDREVFNTSITRMNPFGVDRNIFKVGDLYYNLASNKLNYAFQEELNALVPVIKDFFKEKSHLRYGKVCPQFSFAMEQVVGAKFIDKVGLLVRHPYDIIVSCANRDNNFVTSEISYIAYLQNICHSVNVFLNLIKKGISIFKYEEIITKKGMLNLIGVLDLHDVFDITKIDFKTKINSYEEHKQKYVYTSMEQIIKKDDLIRVKKNLQPFIDIVYKG